MGHLVRVRVRVRVKVRVRATCVEARPIWLRAPARPKRPRLAMGPGAA